jgi:hypothetical protein
MSGPLLIEQQMEAMDLAESDREEVRRFAEFLRWRSRKDGSECPASLKKWLIGDWQADYIPCGFKPPTPGYAACTREKGHTGPCAHPLESLPGQKTIFDRE